MAIIALVAAAVSAGLVADRIARPRHPAQTRPGRIGAEGPTFYGPSVLQFPGRCFRLCREPQTGQAHPCSNDVVVGGKFLDYRGNVIQVESCEEHAEELVGPRRI